MPSGRPDRAGEYCSSVALDNGGATVFGANLDHVSVWQGLVYNNKRGTSKTGLSPGTTGVRARWVSRYASITFNLVGYEYAWAGMNERGLVMSTMSLPATVDPRPDTRPPLDSGEWMQYMLDTCATIEEVIATDSRVRIVTVDHYLVADGSGRAATIEFLAGRMVVHTGAEMPARALTNSTYAQSLATWLTYRQTGNTDYSRLDGSLQRFSIAADMVDRWEPGETEAAVDRAFDTLSAIAGERFSIHASQWSIVFDTKNLRAYYRTLHHPEIRFVDVGSFDPWCTDPVKMLDIDEGLAGDVAGLFYDFSLLTSFEHMKRFLHAWGIPASDEAVRWTVEYLAGFPCQRFRPPRHRLDGDR